MCVCRYVPSLAAFLPLRMGLMFSLLFSISSIETAPPWLSGADDMVCCRWEEYCTLLAELALFFVRLLSLCVRGWMGGWVCGRYICLGLPFL